MGGAGFSSTGLLGIGAPNTLLTDDVTGAHCCPIIFAIGINPGIVLETEDDVVAVVRILAAAFVDSTVGAELTTVEVVVGN